MGPGFLSKLVAFSLGMTLMNAVWRNSAWILAGGSLILAISLGVRHGFGLFLPPMSAEFGWVARCSPSPSLYRT